MSQGALFSHILAGVTPSPWLDLILGQSRRLAQLAGARLSLVHVGSPDSPAVTDIQQAMARTGLDPAVTSLETVPGDPVRRIKDTARRLGADLIVVGAVEREGLFKYYLGSVARSLARGAPCSVLLLSHSLSPPGPFSRIVMATDYTANSEMALSWCVELGRRDQAQALYVVYDYQVLGLSMAAGLEGRGATHYRQLCRLDEMEKLKAFLAAVDTTSLNIEPTCLYGREGWQSMEFARRVDADLLVMPAPQEDLVFVDRVFPHDLEWSLRQLPCALLVARTRVPAWIQEPEQPGKD